MPKYGKPVWQMVEETMGDLPEVFRPKDVINKVKEKYPQVQDNTIRCHVIGCSPNHPSSKWYRLGNHKFFCYLGNSQFRRWQSSDAEQLPEPANELPREEVIDEIFTFSFEADLERHIIRNLAEIEEGLKLYEEGDRTGRQYATDIGRIDLLALDKNGDFVVIELKMQGSDKTCGQLLRYMGWVKHHLANGKNVRGIIVTREANDELKYAVSALGNVKVKEYEVEFTFKDAGLGIE